MSRYVASPAAGHLWRSIVGIPLPRSCHTDSILSHSISRTGISLRSRPLSPGSACWNSSQNFSTTPLTQEPIRSNFLGLRTFTAFAAPCSIPGQLALRESLRIRISPQWRRHIHHRPRRRHSVDYRRDKSSTTNGSRPPAASKSNNGHAQQKVGKKPDITTEKVSKDQNTSDYPILNHLPHLHRPTKEELLAAATGAWSRFKVHFKWFSIKSARPFNMDDISAFFSWIIVGHVVWILVGTTTFVSLTIFLINTVFAQETLARWVGNSLTKSSGMKVVFESAIVPKWGDGVISFKNVFVSRRPGLTRGKSSVSKGSQTSAAAAATAALAERHTEHDEDPEDGNYTQFDLSIDTVNVTLSFAKWFNGKGVLQDVEVKGIRGVVDRTHLQTPAEPVDPRTYKHEHHTGDFELDSFKMEDLLVTVYQPHDFRPFSVSIYSCDLPKLRQQWLFYDFMSANNVSGSFDNSLFTIHPRQTHNYTGIKLTEGKEDGEPTQWKKHSRIRIDGLNIDHLNRGYEGPFSWIHEGNVDIVADIMFPADDNTLAKVMSDFYDRVEATVTSNGKPDKPSGQNEDLNTETKTTLDDNDNRFLVMDLRVSLNNVRAAVPLFTNDLSYVNNALIRPIVAYINSKKAFIPVNCRVVKRLSDFDGSWTIYDSMLMDDLSREMYEAFARDVLDDHEGRKRRIKKVGIWTLQLAAQALFLGLAGNIA
ncbi:hypothetical protein M501DRAFT_1003493 [Patellaria atrata CBS 101060]|uniref:Mitochondrial distribution and morphology protein family 31/32 n=1 Tax=Patellaria atrata CBS 101060 TaxID=1346257 RepID=A0A9P4S0G7_9PEZI|nr:hypothetical protein M501DRAFT_1003493 [Patellaria atrata CBS 101060]